MKLVIDIDEDLYNKVKEDTKAGYVGSDVWIAVANGTPLPKGHGRLIDADKLDTRERGNNSQRTMWWNIDRIVKDAQTIIEADKENDDE